MSRRPTYPDDHPFSPNYRSQLVAAFAKSGAKASPPKPPSSAQREGLKSIATTRRKARA